MTDLAIFVTPTACELLEALPLETTLSGSQMELSTLRCSEGWSSECIEESSESVGGHVMHDFVLMHYSEHAQLAVIC